MAPSLVRPGAFLALRLPPGTHKVCKAGPATTISLGKYGSFNTDSIIGKPYYLTFEIQDSSDGTHSQPLRVVPASELHEESLNEEVAGAESRDEPEMEPDAVEQIDILNEAGEYIVRNNRLTIDDASRQTLSFDEIEALKKAEKGSGKDIVAKILQSHSALNEKTAFSLAKYTLRKTKKFMRRFTVLPLDVFRLGQWLLQEKDAPRIMEMREEAVGLISSWANIRNSGTFGVNVPDSGSGRWLVVDDTSGFLVAIIAERLGILYPSESKKEPDEAKDTKVMDSQQALPIDKRRQQAPDAMSSMHDSITLIHSAAQPNLSLLAYFSFDPNDTSQNAQEHPLHSHLRTISWLQLLSPELDPSYQEPEQVSDAELATWKSAKRGGYYRKRRRWERTKRVINDTQAGGFDGLLVASTMIPHNILHYTIPLLAGGAQVVVYSPVLEPLSQLADAYSSARRTTFINKLRDDQESVSTSLPNEEFPVDPRLLLAPTLQTCRATEWQVLPGRTHPLMTTRGGAEGYIFTGTRVMPAEGDVNAKGNFAKRRRLDNAHKGMKLEEDE